MALIKLAALDGPCQDICDGCEKCHVVVVELAPLVGMRAEYAIGASVTPRDWRGQSAHDTVRLQQRCACEPRLSREVLYDHRTPGRERVAGLRFAARRDGRGPDQSGLPSDTRPKQQFGVARHEFENLHHFEVKDVAD